MPLLKWASALLKNTSDAEREELQSKFDTDFWLLTVNHKLRPDTEIVLLPVSSRGTMAFAYCFEGKWTADLK
jgi:hypothetical protein